MLHRSGVPNPIRLSINLHHWDAGPELSAAPIAEPEVEIGAKNEDGVGTAQRGRAGEPKGTGMAGGQHAAGQPVAVDRRTEHGGECLQRVLGTGPVRARADEDDWAP